MSQMQKAKKIWKIGTHNIYYSVFDGIEGMSPESMVATIINNYAVAICGLESARFDCMLALFRGWSLFNSAGTPSFSRNLNRFKSEISKLFDNKFPEAIAEIPENLTYVFANDGDLCDYVDKVVLEGAQDAAGLT